MKRGHLAALLAGAAVSLSAAGAPPDKWTLPVHVKKLDNGLTVVVTDDHSSPTVRVSIAYHVGMRLEPRNRTGFAHLFEHLMFQGGANTPKDVFDQTITGGGGEYKGSTRPDYTIYRETVPAFALEPVLWLEADRMRALDLSEEFLKNQRDVIKEEIRREVQNQPYGGFQHFDVPKLAFQKWENSHDGYGSFEDLDRATLDELHEFHRDYYGPNNAVLAIAGDVTPTQAFALAQKYFGAIPKRDTPLAQDVSEPLNTEEKRIEQRDALARVPAVAAAWKVPARGSRDHAPFTVLYELLAGGDASRLYQGLVKGRAIALRVQPAYGMQGPWEYDGPTLFSVVAQYKPDGSADAVLAAIDAEVARVVEDGVDAATLERVKARMLADWYFTLESFSNRADTLARLQLLWGDAKVVNRIPSMIGAVTSADIQRVAKTYLARTNRTVIDRRPANAGGQEQGANR